MANGVIKALSINRPKSAGIFIFFLIKLYVLQVIATIKPTQGIDWKLKSKKITEIITSDIASNFFLL